MTKSNMTREKIVHTIGAIVATLHEVGTDCAESTVYMALGMDLEYYHDISGLMVASDLVIISGHRIKLTAKGVALAEDMLVIKS